jgi:hypothetical protein
MPLPQDNLAYPVKIECECEPKNYGSGFLLNYQNKAIFLITAKHVIYEQQENKEMMLHSKLLTISVKDKNLSQTKPIKINIDLNKTKIKISDGADVCCVKIGTLVDIPDTNSHKIIFSDGIDKLKAENVNNFVTVSSDNFLLFDNIVSSADIFVLGYPVSIGSHQNPQLDYDQPLVRKGIIAGKNNLNKTVILDCAVYGGNSGGLAIQAQQTDLVTTKYSVVGIVVEFIPFYEIMYSRQHKYQNLNIENSGYSVLIPADCILDLVKSIDD